jgi:hypothetical protein
MDSTIDHQTLQYILGYVGTQEWYKTQNPDTGEATVDQGFGLFYQQRIFPGPKPLLPKDRQWLQKPLQTILDTYSVIKKEQWLPSIAVARLKWTH